MCVSACVCACAMILCVFWAVFVHLLLNWLVAHARCLVVCLQFDFYEAHTFIVLLSVQAIHTSLQDTSDSLLSTQMGGSEIADYCAICLLNSDQSDQLQLDTGEVLGQCL